MLIIGGLADNAALRARGIMACGSVEIAGRLQKCIHCDLLPALLFTNMGRHVGNVVWSIRSLVCTLQPAEPHLLLLAKSFSF